jgi:hypothetical protein
MFADILFQFYPAIVFRTNPLAKAAYRKNSSQNTNLLGQFLRLCSNPIDEIGKNREHDHVNRCVDTHFQYRPGQVPAKLKKKVDNRQTYRQEKSPAKFVVPRKQADRQKKENRELDIRACGVIAAEYAEGQQNQVQGIQFFIFQLGYQRDSLFHLTSR